MTTHAHEGPEGPRIATVHLLRTPLEVAEKALAEAILPARGDGFEAWLMHHQDGFECGSDQWALIATMLADYQTHADLRLPLPGGGDR